MITISLWQPWASAMAIGLKRYETRGWAAECVGSRIAIHAAKTEVDPKTRQKLSAWWMEHVKGPSPSAQRFAAAFAAAGINDWTDLPKGAVVCTLDLVSVETTERLVESGRVPADSDEFRWGNFAPCDEQGTRPRYGWETTNVERLAVPAPAKGWQNFFTWDPVTNLTRGMPPASRGRVE